MIPNHGKKLKRLYITIISLQLFLIGALRNITVGVGIQGYIKNFLTTQYCTFSDILKFPKDPGYYIFTKIIYLISPNPQIYLAVISAMNNMECFEPLFRRI